MWFPRITSQHPRLDLQPHSSLNWAAPPAMHFRWICMQESSFGRMLLYGWLLEALWTKRTSPGGFSMVVVFHLCGKLRRIIKFGLHFLRLLSIAASSLLCIYTMTMLNIVVCNKVNCFPLGDQKGKTKEEEGPEIQWPKFPCLPQALKFPPLSNSTRVYNTSNLFFSPASSNIPQHIVYSAFVVWIQRVSLALITWELHCCNRFLVCHPCALPLLFLYKEVASCCRVGKQKCDLWS